MATRGSDSTTPKWPLHSDHHIIRHALTAEIWFYAFVLPVQWECELFRRRKSCVQNENFLHHFSTFLSYVPYRWHLYLNDYSAHQSLSHRSQIHFKLNETPSLDLSWVTTSEAENFPPEGKMTLLCTAPLFCLMYCIIHIWPQVYLKSTQYLKAKHLCHFKNDLLQSVTMGCNIYHIHTDLKLSLMLQPYWRYILSWMGVVKGNILAGNFCLYLSRYMEGGKEGVLWRYDGLKSHQWRSDIRTEQPEGTWRTWPRWRCWTHVASLSWWG